MRLAGRGAVERIAVYAGLLALVWGLSGCSTLGVPSPQTFNQRLAAAYQTASGIADTILVLEEAGKISPMEEASAVKRLSELRAALDLALSLHVNAPQTSETDLQQALSGLQELDTVLKSKSVTKPAVWWFDSTFTSFAVRS